MQLTGPSQILFPNGSGQQSLSISATGAVGTVSYQVTQIPATVASVRKTATGTPLAVGATLTAAEAANLFVTRTAGTGLGPVIGTSACVGVKTRTFVTGATAPAFTTGSATSVQAIKDGNFWEPNFPTSGTGTRTVDILIDIGTAMVLGNIPDILISLGYGGATTNQWTGVTAKGLISTNGTAVTVLGALTITANGIEGNNQKNIAGNVTTTASARWVGVRLEKVPVNYPLIVKNASFRAKITSGYTTLPTPVYFSVKGTDAGGLGATIPTSSMLAVRSRTFVSGATPPTLTNSSISGVQAGNFWEPNFPTSGTGTRTVDLLVDVGTAQVLGRIDDIQLSMGYGPYTSDAWTGIVAKALISTDGAAVTPLNTLTITGNASEPFKVKNLSGNVTGAVAARWMGIRLENVPVNYPLIMQNIAIKPQGGGTSTADYTVPIGDTSTNFGTTPPSSNLTVYGDPGTRFPLGVAVNPPASSYNLTIGAGLTLVEQVGTPGFVTLGSSFTATNASGPFAPVQLGTGVTGSSLALNGMGATFSNNAINIPGGDAYLSTPALGLPFPATSSAATTQTPPMLTLSYTGMIPSHSAVLASVFSWAEGGISLFGNWASTSVQVRIERDESSEMIVSDPGLSNTAIEDIAVKYVDNPSGAGGTITFYRNGLAHGTPKTTTFKPRVTAQAALEVNALTGNTAAGVPSGSSLAVRKVGVSIDQAVINYSYQPVSSGTVSAAKLQSLYVDATAVTAPQPARQVTYQPVGGAIQAIDVVIGPLAVPAGQAYRAVLEDWSSGSAVSHPNALVMTKIARQNCKFEDNWLFNGQAGWIECLPQGAVPVIGGIAYYCEAIRIGSYAQFQFGYDWTTATMPNNPFGDPSGKESYMVPHKWRIEDSTGAVLGTVQRPDGGPLNGTDIPRIFSGAYDGRNVAITNSTNKWYPHGTVRSAVIWRSGPPPAYSQTVINAQLPRYDMTVPYAMHTDYSCNGFDLRIFQGGSGEAQANGFGNTRVMPYNPTNYSTLVPQAGVTQDPYKATLYSANSLAAVSSTWLKYTPFNQAGRSPTTGPGGLRDDRVAIPEPVAEYMYNVSGTRPHDGTAFATIALDFVTSYASDPYHCFEGGRCTPLFKGAKASRVLTMRNHYYGPGEATTPPERAYYVQGGRISEIMAQGQPFRCHVPYGGIAGDKPVFGTNQIDAAHAHQFPHWGSMLWQTPEFAFLGHKLWDQARLYESVIINDAGGYRWAIRDGAWQFLHAALAWKTASANSDRLYSRAEVMAYVVADFEGFHDNHKVANPGFDNPPSNVMPGGQLDERLAIYAAAARFGPAIWLGEFSAIGQHDFMTGYWVSALGIAEKLGFNDALRGASTKAAAVLDWMIAQQRKRIVGRINQAPRANLADASYQFVLWRGTDIASVGGNVASLPQTYTAVATQNGNAATWDVVQDLSGTTHPRDSQALDQLIAGPSIMKNQLEQTGSDLDAALATVTSWRNQKKTEQLALGVDAGSTWFKSLNGANNPALT